ncbi:porin [Fusobacterium necrophorum]|uniref:Porin n=3 Tax=Fusobacterium necrophorum TaxID=859 RepID=A0AAW6W834_9FUSO|nr:porin [Fusobacterium necrophorum]AYV94473.1 porin [Fusobacterium necrophorum subsp. funduliforme]MDK4473931.1 porin [Fusobacterium necrophorum]MDK4480753.1 porin [Fusobacterium necrophorum]MDK4482584.1 porin [Fusobacterium necrophorum]MDK4495617.1 porin [Fusobacterium necrophorum]
MKKLALVLGSLLVIGSAASAKEVMPAPMPEPEVKIVEKPVEVIVYRDRVVEAPAKWKPNGYVSVMTKTMGRIENTGEKHNDQIVESESVPVDERTWRGSDPKTRLEVKASANITENQNVEFRLRDWKGLTHRNNKNDKVDEYYLQHTYKFGKLGDSKVDFAVESRFQVKNANDKFIRERFNFDFAEYLFSNDYVKTTAAVLAPEFKYAWTHSDNHTETYGLYADYQADIIGGVTFEAEFKDLFAHSRENVANGKDLKGNKGDVEFTLNRPTTLYAAGKHKVVFEPKLVYATSWAYDKKTIENGIAGIERENGKKEKWRDYTAKFEPILKYSYQATEYVKLMANAGAEYVNRNEDRHSASHWRWQPYAELGMRVNF